MNDSRIVVKYHSRRMLSTVDLNALFDTLFGAYGDDLIVEFAEMDDPERSEATDMVEGLRVVRERFRIFEVASPAGALRREDLEHAAVACGRR